MLRLPEEGAPATPPAGKIAVYAKTDSRLYFKDDAGVEHELLDSAGATFTGPVLFDTVADIASAASIDLTAYGSGAIATVTGTTATTTFVMSDGQKVTLKAAAAWPLTYHATTNKVVGGESYTCTAGELVELSCTGGVIDVRPVVGRSEFGVSKAASGWQKLPSGLIIQWGITSAITSGSFVGVTFPLAFPSACVSMTLGLSSGVISANYTGGVSSLSTTGANVSHYSTAGNAGYYWIAVGY